MKITTNLTYLLLFTFLIFGCSGVQQNKEQASSETVTEKEAFQYVVPKPVNGALYGVIELGGSGFNSFVIEIDSTGTWELIEAKFGESKVYDGDVSLELIKSGLETYMQGMLDKGVQADRVYFVQSSTASESEKVQEINTVLKELGYWVKNVDANEEGTFAFNAVMPDLFKSNSLMIDIGSGNTKITWLENGEVHNITVNGSKYFQDGISDEEVYQKIKTALTGIPSDRMERCFMIGGAPYGLAKLDEDYYDRFTPLKEPSFYSNLDDKKTQAGLNIYKSFYDNLENCKHFVFDWDSNFSVGYLLQLHASGSL